MFTPKRLVTGGWAIGWCADAAAFATLTHVTSEGQRMRSGHVATGGAALGHQDAVLRVGEEEWGGVGGLPKNRC